jgi:hypothetical protein
MQTFSEKDDYEQNICNNSRTRWRFSVLSLITQAPEIIIPVYQQYRYSRKEKRGDERERREEETEREKRTLFDVRY